MRPCDICAAITRVLRFNVTRSTFKGRRTITRGAGSIYLCEGCWTTFCQPRTIAARRKAREAEDWSQT